MSNKKLELLSPAGNLHKMKVALAHGADAVYAGIPDFSLRVRINDFDMAKIEEATEYCHVYGKLIYITLNIFAHNKHLDKLPAYIKELKRIGVDALIISDPGVLAIVKSIWDTAEIHLSTQANCTNWQSAKFWSDAGVARVILGREVTLDEIREIREKVPALELECFVHGAMCMAYSGRCFLSKEYMNRSGNLGDCIQPCRWRFDEMKAKSTFIAEERRHDDVFELVEEEHGSYLLNSKDLCLIEHLKELRDAGVASFKIEGRAKSVYYQAVVAGIYSQVLHNLDKVDKAQITFLRDELDSKITNRGYTEGFLFDKEGMLEGRGQAFQVSHKKVSWEFCGEVMESGNKVRVHNTLRFGDIVEAVMPDYKVQEIKIGKIYNDQGEVLEEAHGGGKKLVTIESNIDFPVFSVFRRKV